MWEDAANKQGGRWVITLNKSSKNDLDNLWLDVVSIQYPISRITSIFIYVLCSVTCSCCVWLARLSIIPIRFVELLLTFVARAIRSVSSKQTPFVRVYKILCICIFVLQPSGQLMATTRRPLWKLDTNCAKLCVWDARTCCSISCTRTPWSSRAPASSRSILCKDCASCSHSLVKFRNVLAICVAFITGFNR